MKSPMTARVKHRAAVAEGRIEIAGAEHPPTFQRLHRRLLRRLQTTITHRRSFPRTHRNQLPLKRTYFSNSEENAPLRELVSAILGVPAGFFSTWGVTASKRAAVPRAEARNAEPA